MFSSPDDTVFFGFSSAMFTTLVSLLQLIILRLATVKSQSNFVFSVQFVPIIACIVQRCITSTIIMDDMSVFTDVTWQMFTVRFCAHHSWQSCRGCPG